MMVPSGAAFVDRVMPLVGRYEDGDAEGAVHGFLALVGDRDWRNAIERTVPGGIAQAVMDAATFFLSELPAVSDWTFEPEQATAITCPVLSVLGSKTSPLFVEGHELLHEWFPQCRDADITDASHLLQMEAPGPVAAAIAAFVPTLSKHPAAVAEIRRRQLRAGVGARRARLPARHRSDGAPTAQPRRRPPPVRHALVEQRTTGLLPRRRRTFRLVAAQPRGRIDARR